jgi:hypothetical protein
MMCAKGVVGMTILFVAALGLVLAAVLALWPRKPSGPAAFDREDPGDQESLGEVSRPPGGRRWGGPRLPGEQWEPVAPWRSRRPAEQPERGRGAPATLEGILTAQRICGEISQIQYLRALEGLAARDEERHPLVLRWDDRPGACS